MRARMLMGGAAALLVALAGVAGAQGQSQSKAQGKGAAQSSKAKSEKSKSGKDSANDVFGKRGQEKQELKGRFTDAERRSWEEAFARSNYHAKSLPPGIAKNLERGKPLPPGIAKTRVPDDVMRRIPRTTTSNEEYEHVIVGRDVVRTDKAGRIVDILSGIVVR